MEEFPYNKSKQSEESSDDSFEDSSIESIEKNPIGTLENKHIQPLEHRFIQPSENRHMQPPQQVPIEYFQQRHMKPLQNRPKVSDSEFLERIVVQKSSITEPLAMIKQNDILDILHCIVCLSVVYEPKECSDCSVLICEGCLANIQKTNQSGCPKCRTENAFRKMNLNMMKVYETTKFQGCPFPNCQMKSTIELQDLFKHFLKDCQFMEVECPLQCGAYFRKGQSQYHYLQCPMNIAKCEKCDYEQPYSEWVIQQQHPFKPHDCLEFAFKRINQSEQTVNHLQNEVTSLRDELKRLMESQMQLQQVINEQVQQQRLSKDKQEELERRIQGINERGRSKSSSKQIKQEIIKKRSRSREDGEIDGGQNRRNNYKGHNYDPNYYQGRFGRPHYYNDKHQRER